MREEQIEGLSGNIGERISTVRFAGYSIVLQSREPAPLPARCKWTLLIKNGQCGIESGVIAILFSAEYKEVAAGAPTGTLRAKAARQEDVECNTSRKVFSLQFVELGALASRLCSDPRPASRFPLLWYQSSAWHPRSTPKSRRTCPIRVRRQTR